MHEDTDNLTSLPDNFSENSSKSLNLQGMFQNWFLDYASYVILERAVPHLNDGLKPVQRRILHSMKELEDGRYNKVANLVGNTMKYHPHGDASIGDALVQLGQKDLLIDCQGNWGNIFTGDEAAASRYIEARLSKFALDVVYSPKITEWQPSYDGRNQEPTTLPVKFPLLLAQGVRGIAVGLSSDILPYNFCELLEASIAILKDEPFEIFPDFPTGGLADFSNFKDGARGGKAQIRARIKQVDKRTLAITEIPYGTTTKSLIKSIVLANEKGKIKIKKIDDNTAKEVEILIQIPNDTSVDQTIDALYAFTNCQISYSPNACVVVDNKPRFLTASEILKYSTKHTVNLLKQELQVQLNELQEKWQWISLERIFIEHEIYEDIKECKTDESINETIDKGLKPHVKNLIRPVLLEDILKLRKIPIDRISKYNSNKADQTLLAIEADIKQVKDHLLHIVNYAIGYFTRILKQYGEGRKRKTELRSFETIEAANVAVANEKLYVDKIEGFAGYRLKGAEYVCDCSDMDDIIAIRSNGTFVVTKVQEKVFIGKDIIHINIFRKNDERTIYNMVYQDGSFGNAKIKRFNIGGIVRDKEYDLTKGNKGSKVLYLSENPNGEAEIIKVYLKPKARLRALEFDYNFADVNIQNRGSGGKILSRNAVKKVVRESCGISTLSARTIWFDTSVKRLNVEGHGIKLGSFKGNDKILVVTASGYFRTCGFDLSLHFEDDLLLIQKFNPHRILTVVYSDQDTNTYFVKRFHVEETEKPANFLDCVQHARLIYVTDDFLPRVSLSFEPNKKGETREDEEIIISEFETVKKYKAKGKRLSNLVVAKVQLSDPIPYEEPEEQETEEPDALHTSWMDETEPQKTEEKGTQSSLFDDF